MPISEAFGFEESWIRRGLHELVKAPDLFSPSRLADAQLILGLGNRKVLALWDWLREAGLVTGVRERARPTGVAEVMLHYDPRLQEYGSLWVLHTHLGLNPDGAWFYHDYASVYRDAAFTRAELQQFLASRRKHSESYIVKRCLYPLLHIMRKTRIGPELGVMTEVAAESFQRQQPRDECLHPAIFAYATLVWAAAGKLATANLLQFVDNGGPARLFAAGQSDAERQLRRISERYDKAVLSYSGTAGLNSVAFAGRVQALHLLEAYYLEHLEGKDPPDALRCAQADGLAGQLLREGERG